MTKPDDIPQDVWDAAQAAMSIKHPPNAPWVSMMPTAIAKAIMADRERVALALWSLRAETEEFDNDIIWNSALDAAASAINAREQKVEDRSVPRSWVLM